jgi:hypothetical protein
MTVMAALALSGCLGGTRPAGDKPVPAKPAGDTIRFVAGPCFGFCPSYAITVEPDGSAVLIPERNTSVPGETRLTVTPLQYRKLRDSFTPFRPVTGTTRKIAQGENCDHAATDMSNYQIVWTRQGQKKTELDFYAGCFDARYARLRAAVQAVPKTLDIEKMLKADR